MDFPERRLSPKRPIRKKENQNMTKPDATGGEPTVYITTVLVYGHRLLQGKLLPLVAALF